jgi:CheY-like chemotaxis protein/HPt (histidine-containing phosphotransfer) domain-containing protein
VPEASGTGLVLMRPMGAFDRPTDLARHGFDAWISKPVSEVRLRTVLLHVTAEPVGERSPAEEGSEPRPTPRQLGARVLLAEDNIVNQKVAQLFLTQIGCSVDVALTGMEAIEKVMAREFDLVLMDCLMPEIDGYDATRAIRLLSDPVKSRVPIVAMTTGSQPADRETCIAAGMDDQVTKPVRLEELMRVVRHWSARPSQASTESTMDDNSLDPEVIATLRDLGGDDPSIFNELVELFLSDTPPRIRALEAALESGNPKDLEAAAHALKSSSGNLGAYVLSGLFKELESCGRSKDLDAAAPLVAQSREEYHRVEVALREEMD